MLVVPRIPITDGMIISSNVPNYNGVGTIDPAVWSAGTTYAVDTAATGLTNRVVVPSNLTIYRSRTSPNLNHDPVADVGDDEDGLGTNWQVVGAVNRMRMFDERVDSQTTNPLLIDTTLGIGQSFDTFVAINVDADTIQLIMTATGEGEVDNRTVGLADPLVDDYWEWYFSPIPLLTNAQFFNLPPYPGATTRVIATKASGTAGVGAMVFGLSEPGGTAEWGLKMGIDDYSTKAANGKNAIKEGPYANNMSLTAWVKKGAASNLQRVLTRLRATPAVYIGTEIDSDTIVYGWPDTWERVFRTLREDFFNISLKGLT